MIVTTGWPCELEVVPGALLPHAATVTATAAPAPSTSSFRDSFISELLCSQGKLEARGVAGQGRRTPGQQAVLQHGDQSLCDQRDDRDDQHGREDTVGVEGALRL